MAGELVFVTGATGFVGFAVLTDLLKSGYRVRVSVRRDAQIEKIKQHPSIKPFADRLDFVIVPDITADGAFDGDLKGVTYVQHIASPLPRPSEDPEKDIIQPAIRGTLSILNSALKTNSVKRIVITSSAVAVIPGWALANGDPTTVYGPNSRVRPLPTAPWGNFASAYRAAKCLALEATDRFIEEKRPHFSIVNIMPGYVLGPNELKTTADSLLEGSNGIVLGLVLGKTSPMARPGSVVDVRDVARIHVEALDEVKVPKSRSFILDTGKTTLEDAIHLVKKNFPEIVGTLPLNGSCPTVFQNINAGETAATFGPLLRYEDSIKGVVAQYLGLRGTGGS